MNLRAVPYSQRECASSESAPLVDVQALQQFVAEHPRLFVITGAGISHASGIPTYRDEIGNWKSNTPIQHGEFLKHVAVRRRYWARSFVGWPNVGNAQPNKAHRGLVVLENGGYIKSLVTQNIDRLHQKAGQKRVIDLHGRLDQVVCMDCGALTPREQIQQWLWQHNPHLEHLKAELAPDGDADVREDLIRQVAIPDCQHCGGLLKPNVVFYGGSVGREKVNYLYDKLSAADAMLVIGSSLMVYSSFRFCKFAAERQIPIACINQGMTRADGLLVLKVSADCGEVLSELASALSR
ncbi:MAG: NAD-dependent protein deacetylase [Proteobacteria bacterium]|nr:NAD-dependent protein deacetylase [Pseudomonadota bacterium]MDA0927186.1 NAD-dependent protein deacetylase [Pseudomonadota bacterium]